MVPVPEYSFLILLPVLRQIYQTLGSKPAEQGGILGIADGVISRFYYDVEGLCSERDYYPDIKSISKVIKEWGNEGVSFCGIVHSHHPSARLLSSKDIDFGRAILRMNPSLNSVFFPLVFSVADNTEYEFIPYVIDEKSVSIASIRFSNQI